MREIVGHELIDDEQFLTNLDSLNPKGYSRSAEINPTDLIFAWIHASVQKRQPGAKKLKRQYLDLVEQDAQYYGLTPEELFELHKEALDDEYANYEIEANH